MMCSLAFHFGYAAELAIKYRIPDKINLAYLFGYVCKISPGRLNEM